MAQRRHHHAITSDHFWNHRLNLLSLPIIAMKPVTPIDDLRHEDENTELVSSDDPQRIVALILSGLRNKLAP